MAAEVLAWLKAHESELNKVSEDIFRHPETALQETYSSHCLAEYLETNGFSIRWNLAGMDTAFLAEWGEGEPVLGFLAEYDALPGLGQEAVSFRSPIEGAGHGCGHNLLGTACAGAACALKDWMIKEGEKGTIRIYGCPAEETATGKVRMDEAGIFKDLSVAVTWHPFDRNRVSYDIWQAQSIRNYRFYGTSAHASKYPEMGRSALDAAELMNVGVNYLREHVADDVRIHYTYISDSEPANIVPAYAATNYFVRSSSGNRTDSVVERVDDCARGAALMTGTKVEIEEVTRIKATKLNRTLSETFYEAMKQVEVPTYTPEELTFAKEISAQAELDNNGVYFTGLEPLETEPGLLAIGTDVANVSHTVPTVMLSAACHCKGTPLHHWATTAQAGMGIGQKGMMYAASCMAMGSVMLIQNPEIIRKAWIEHKGEDDHETA